ncbi:hypothetical protein LXL04_015307 [Taraxacum kok-saghyz]
MKATKKDTLLAHIKTPYHDGTESGYITFRDVSLKDEDEDSDDQQVQLDDLWRKYVTKMMTSDLNNLKASVYSYLPKYDELPLDKKMEMDTDKHFDRMQTRIAFLD